jgi:CRP-like cAMP-binding protein
MLDLKTNKMLRQSPLFDGLEDELVEQIFQSGRPMTLKGRHGRICKKDLSRRLYFIVSGEMRMLRMSPDGQEHLLQRFRAGEFFCLSSVTSGRSCNSLMANAGTVELLFWGHETFLGLMKDDAAFHLNVMKQLAWQLEQERDMRALSRCCKADVRVAAYLLNRAKSGSCACHCLRAIDIRPVSLTAQELGLARETLSRSLQRLVKRQAISYQRGQIQVLNSAELDAVLEETDCVCQQKAS